MKRRTWCLQVATLVLPIGARSQGRKKDARICVVNTVPRQDPSMQLMFSRLADLGWSTGLFGSGNLKIEYREVSVEQTELAPVIESLQSSKCDLIVTMTTPTTLAAMSAAPTVPRVFLIGADPVATGLVANMTRPGGQATGWTAAHHESGRKLVALLKEVAPSARKVAVVYSAGNAGSQQIYSSLASYAESVRTLLKAYPVRTRQEVHALDAVWTREPVDGLVVPFEPITYAYKSDIIQLAALHRLPAAYGNRSFVDVGGLLSYGINYPVEVKRTADFIARILDGNKPADIPVETAQHFELLVNRRTARVLGLNVPQSVLAQATEIVE